MSEQKTPPVRQRRRLTDTTQRTKRVVDLGELSDSEAMLEKTLKGEFTSTQIEDPFSDQAGHASTSKLNEIKWPFNPAALLKLAQENSVLKQCIEAMVTNVSGHGHRLEYVGPEGDAQNDASEAEAAAIESFMSYPNDDYSMLELRRRVRWDLEATGNAFIEVARNRRDEVSACWHVPAHLVRLTETDKETTTVKTTLPRFSGPQEVNVQKHFRRFVQVKGTEKVYFKEYGDPRSIDPKDGSEKALPIEDTATEIIHLKLYHAGYAYGLPHWINNIVAIQGSRQAELTNLDYFSDNAIPAMVMMVSGGQLTQNTVTALEDHFTALRGRQAANRVVVVEAFGDPDAKGEDGTIPPPRVELKPMSSERPKEGMFLEYDKLQTEKVRSSFRLPPIFLGLSEEYTHATANTSYDVAEGQVFGPARVMEDDIINRKILGDYNLQYWEVRSNPPRITDPTEILDAIDSFNDVGAMTPNTAIGIANEMFDLSMDLIEEPWGDMPMSVVDQLVTSGKIKPDEDGKLILSEEDDTQNQPPVVPSVPIVEPTDPEGDDGVVQAMQSLRKSLMSDTALAAARANIRKRTLPDVLD